ncbi:MAG: methyl-accepting chemotaxis protein [Myxococcota bacterium]
MIGERRHDRSIDRQLVWAIALTTTVSLLGVFAALILYESRTLREDLVSRGTMLARVVGTNSAVALSFDDAGAVQENLAALNTVPDVLEAHVFDIQGRPFAAYRSNSTGVEPGKAPTPRPEGHEFGDRGLEMVESITFQGVQVGTIMLWIDTKSLSDRIWMYLWMGAGVSVVALVLSFLIAGRLRRQIAQPLASLRDNTAAVAQGDLTRPLSRSADDEIGDLVGSFNAMTVGLRELVAQVRQSIGGVSEVSRVLEERSASLANQASRQSVAVADSAESVEQVSDSIRDVNVNAERLADVARETSSSVLQLDAAIGEIANHMDQLAGAIDTASGAATQVTTSISQVAGGVQSLQVASADTAERLSELSTSVVHVKENAAETFDLSEESSREAGEGMDAVRETIGAMGEIQSSFSALERRVSRLADKSQSIEEIVQVIKDVADQTSLLSLNAAIIAAQSGEHGRAFSVVAEQVKGLADRTHHSAREITELIRAVQSDTETAVQAVGEGGTVVERGVQRSNVAGEVLSRILDKTRASTDHVRRIVEATERQALELDRVEQSLVEVRTIGRAIDQSTHDQQIATSEIADSVDNIRQLGMAVRDSTEEQRRGSSLITRAVSDFSNRVQQIAEATSAQAKSSETIQTALQVFTDVTEESKAGAEEINQGVAGLLERAARLESEIGRFKTDREDR